MRESTIEAYFKRRVKEAGGLTRKFVSPGRRGVPDQIVVWPNRVDFIEVKAPGQKPRPDQTREHERLREHGAYVGVLWGVEDVDRYVKWRTE